MQTHWESGALRSAPAGPVRALSRFARRLYRAISAYFLAQLDAHAATAMYEQLSRLSDAELARRGMTRADLHRHVFEHLTMRP
jgi:hypothetical protein